jgi:hypothetical protein
MVLVAAWNYTCSALFGRFRFQSRWLGISYILFTDCTNRLFLFILFRMTNAHIVVSMILVAPRHYTGSALFDGF